MADAEEQPASLQINTIHTGDLDQTGNYSSTDLGAKDSQHASCHCLSTIGILLTELEAKSLVTERSGSLDSMLAAQKEFLARCQSVLNCLDCSMRAEYILLLGLLAQNLTNLCETTVNKYLEEIRPSAEHSSSSSDACIPSPPSETSFKVNLGQYEVESTQEWHTLMKVLIVMQLQVTIGITFSLSCR